MNNDQLRELITETLQEIDLYSEKAVRLLMGTAAQESHLGEYIHQINGPALGIMQMEPATFKDHVRWLSKREDDLIYKIMSSANIQTWSVNDLKWNLKLSIAMARVHYLRKPDRLPTTIEEMAAYYKKFYNTYLGAATEEEFINNYNTYVL